MLSLFFKRFYLFIFRQRGRKREREGGKHQCVVSPHAPPTGDWPATQACVLTGNRTDDPLVCRPALNPLSHTSQGLSLNTEIYNQSSWRHLGIANRRNKNFFEYLVKPGTLGIYILSHVCFSVTVL